MSFYKETGKELKAHLNSGTGVSLKKFLFDLTHGIIQREEGGE